MPTNITRAELTETLNGAIITDLDVDQEVGAFKIILKDGRILSLSDNGDELSVAIFTDQAHYTEQVENFKQRNELRAVLKVAAEEFVKAVKSGRFDIADDLVTRLSKKDDTIQ